MMIKVFKFTFAVLALIDRLLFKLIICESHEWIVCTKPATLITDYIRFSFDK